MLSNFTYAYFKKCLGHYLFVCIFYDISCQIYFKYFLADCGCTFNDVFNFEGFFLMVRASCGL